ncbi:threonylcarbamoyl-AMP synthase [Candidatus Dojkabacteria bacterium]|nr:threonylcarbamoyl-AMP synthase [Candidatus Dojkabacteria bacterium]
MENFLEFEKAIECLEQGEIIVVPTDTIPGLAIDAVNQRAIQKIYKTKKRDKSKTLPLLFSSIKQVKEYLSINHDELKLAKKFWPGALTLVLNSKGKLPQILENSAGKIGARIPANNATKKLIEEFGKPLAATSINISAEPSIIKLEEIPAEILAQIAGILAGNYESSGKASTVAEVTKNEIKIYREGGTSKNELEKTFNV